MFVATTNDMCYGASVICTYDFFKQAARKIGGSYYVLPSSIHEILLVKENPDMLPNNFQQLVGMVNYEKLDETERLTDNAYHYDARKDLLETATEYEARLEKERETKKIIHADSLHQEIQREKNHKRRKNWSDKRGAKT